MKLPRLTALTGIAGQDGKPTGLFARFWDQICGAIESPAAVTSPPATAASPGRTGQIAYDATHFYICIAVDTWVRVAIATW